MTHSLASLPPSSAIIIVAILAAASYTTGSYPSRNKNYLSFGNT